LDCIPGRGYESIVLETRFSADQGLARAFSFACNLDMLSALLNGWEFEPVKTPCQARLTLYLGRLVDASLRARHNYSSIRAAIFDFSGMPLEGTFE